MGKIKMKIAVVTTFHSEGLKKYAQRMIDTFCENWPEEITLHIYPEKCNPIVRNHNHVTLFSLDDVRELTEFKNHWKNVPKANGDVSGDPVRGGRKDSKKAFKWHAVRFAHKVYDIFDCARTTDADVLFWMDGTDGEIEQDIVSECQNVLRYYDLPDIKIRYRFTVYGESFYDY
jgi:hypothetical protein